jgi:hypothetical protein
MDGSAAADASPLEAALLHLDTDFEPHRLSHGPGDTAVSRPTTRRVVVVRSGARGSAARFAVTKQDSSANEAHCWIVN